MRCQIPVELQRSYLRSSDYPENLIPTDPFFSKAKLVSYRKRLDEVESDSYLLDHQVDTHFEIPVIDIGTGYKKGNITISLCYIEH